MATKLYAQISSALVAMRNCQKTNNSEWEAKHLDTIENLVRELPSGGGFDSGTSIDLDASQENKLVLNTAFHHMTDNGMYDGWTEHTVIIRPSFDGFTVDVKGRDRNDIKDYIAQSFYDVQTPDERQT